MHDDLDFPDLGEEDDPFAAFDQAPIKKKPAPLAKKAPKSNILHQEEMNNWGKNTL